MELVTDRQILEAILAEVKGFGIRMDGFEGRMDGFEGRMDDFEGRMDRMEKCQERFEEETRNNFADIKLHLENTTDKNLSILAENYQNVIDKMNVPITWMNRVMMNEIRINSLTDQVAKLQEKCS
ncbi:hypothetical protein GKZ57_06375 [Blautia luti DSM 14534]|uniref:Uncharacterized protein n=1 Tax=Blautia luti DSM 14534 = JCM 17040 TaxID=649762 RepID=A0A844GM79_9FIRM|nr:hypothetical protein [Blautia luti DSM 14534 = JCM 17040]